MCLSCFVNQTTFIDMSNPFEILEERLIRIEHLLADLKLTIQKQNAQKEAEELLTAKQAAALLNIALPTLYGYTSRMEIPVSKKGKRLYFSKKELLEWVKEGRQKTRFDILQDANKRDRRKMC